MGVVPCTFSNASKMTMLSAFALGLENLVIVGSTIEYLDCNESVFTGDNHIGSSTIKGLNFADAQVKGMTFDDCMITAYIIINKTRFDGLALNNIQYDDDIKVTAKDTEYVNSDKFPAGK